MINYRYILVLSICYSTTFQAVNAQKEIYNTNTLKSLKSNPLAFPKQLVNTDDPSFANTGITESQNSSVFIQQIGANNRINTIVNSQNSNIRLVQDGSKNNIEINETSKEIDKLIVQKGNQNRVSDVSFNSDISTKLELIQNWDQLTFERFGSNELTKNIKFTMSGQAKTIIVRSF